MTFDEYTSKSGKWPYPTQAGFSKGIRWPTGSDCLWLAVGCSGCSFGLSLRALRGCFPELVVGRVTPAIMGGTQVHSSVIKPGNQSESICADASKDLSNRPPTLPQMKMEADTDPLQNYCRVPYAWSCASTTYTDIVAGANNLAHAAYELPC